MRVGKVPSASVLLLGVACSGSPTSPGFNLVIVDGPTASFRETDITLLKYNLSWYPTDDSPMPPPGNVFATMLVQATNRSDASRRITRDELALRTFPEGFQLHAGPIWHALNQGRNPRLAETTLLPGGTVTEWLTYSVPMDKLAEELLWSPGEEFTFAIEIPFWEGGRIEEALIFGKVRDASGAPLAHIPLTLTSLETVPGIPASETNVGHCRGVLNEILEVTTDASGRYQVTLSSVHTTELCIDVHPAADSLHRVTGAVRPGRPTEMAEIPQLRLDLVLGERFRSESFHQQSVVGGTIQAGGCRTLDCAVGYPGRSALRGRLTQSLADGAACLGK